MVDLKEIKDKVLNKSIYNKERCKNNGEVFTPFELIEDMVNSINFDKIDLNSTILDPCAGKGNFTIILLEKLMIKFKNIIENEDDRYRHIIENMIYMIDINDENVKDIQDIFSLNGKIKVNIIKKNFLDL